MREKDLKHILHQDYNFEKNCKSILTLLFGKIVLNTWLKMRKSEIAERMRLFTVKSPDILNPIIQS